jgi:hypothetical protein
MTVNSAARLIDRSEVAAGSAINRLAEAGILTQRNVGRQRYRVFEASDVLELFTAMERALASPSGDTAKEPPVRRYPDGKARGRSRHDRKSQPVIEPAEGGVGLGAETKPSDAAIKRPRA